MFRGSIVALVTPFHVDEVIDWQALKNLIEFHVATGTDGIVVAGTTGEAATLMMAEKTELIRQTVSFVNGRTRVIAGTAAASTKEAIKLTASAMEEGVDACLIMAPPYIKPTQEGLFLHYRAIAEAVAIPQILYNVPSRTACDIHAETVARLAEFPNIVGIKEATGNIERTRDIIRLSGKKLDVLSGDDATAVDCIAAGGKGVISVTANVAPKQMKVICDAALSGNLEEAYRLNENLKLLHQELFIESNPIPVKWALHEMGLIPAGIRLPLTPLSYSAQAPVRKAMQRAGLINELNEVKAQ